MFAPLVIVGALIFATLIPPSEAAAVPCTLLEVESPRGAELKVYFTKFPSEDHTEGSYRTCRIVTKAVEGTKSFYVTPFRRDSNVVVHRDNWPR